MKYQSNCQWPAFTLPGQDDLSTDRHATRGEASMVCQCLLADGFAGKGKIFPVKTWVTELKEKCPVKNDYCDHYSFQYDRNGEVAIEFCGHSDNEDECEGNCLADLCPLENKK